MALYRHRCVDQFAAHSPNARCRVIDPADLPADSPTRQMPQRHHRRTESAVATLADALPPEIRAAIDRGWSVIPCGAKKRPLVLWKDYQTGPLTSNELTNWANRNPATWAVVTGTVSGVVVLDFDGEAGAETLARLGLRAHVVTPSGGVHVYCQHPGSTVPTINHKTHPALGAARPGMDIRGDGGYACFVGRTNKGSYRPVRDFADLAPAEVVTRVLAAVQDAKEPTPSPGAAAASGDGTHPEGERHGALVSFAGRCRRAGMDGSEILAALRQFNAAHCQPPKPESELHRIADDIAGRAVYYRRQSIEEWWRSQEEEAG